MCDSVIALTGTEYTGTCDACDLAFVTEGTVAKEAGYDCNYENRLQIASWVNVSWLPTRWMAYRSGAYTWPLSKSTFYDSFWTGLPKSSTDTDPDIWIPLIADGWTGSDVSYSKGVLSWYQEYRVAIPIWEVDYTCSGGSFTYGSSYYGGTYGAKVSTTCGNASYYDRWSFTAPTSEYAYVSVDTLSSKTTFDPYIIVTAGKSSCQVGQVNNSFACTYPSTGGSCPSIKFFANKGEEYDVIVMDLGSCASTTTEYKILVDTTGDPGLTQDASYAPRYMWADARIDGSATVTP